MEHRESFIMRTSKFFGALLLMALFVFVLAFIVSYLMGNDILGESAQQTEQVNTI